MATKCLALAVISGRWCSSAVYYDSLKNMIGKNGDVPYSYNSANQLIRQNGTFYAEYDANGRRFRAETQQWNLNGSGAFASVPYLNLFNKQGKNLAEIDHRVDAAGNYAKKNHRNHIYFGGAALFEYDDCQISKNNALGICGDHDGIPDFYDIFPTNANPVFPLEGAGGFKGSSIAESIQPQ